MQEPQEAVPKASQTRGDKLEKQPNMTILKVSTKNKREVVDLTERCRKEFPHAKTSDGICHLFLLHTTAALTIADLDPGTDLDFLDAFNALIPKLNYRHPHDPAHVPDHILSALIGTSLTVPVKNGQILLGEWQRIVLIEFDGPRRRKIAFSLMLE
jgi:secondary thiamine-phosphate synthase enzyme